MVEKEFITRTYTDINTGTKTVNIVRRSDHKILKTEVFKDKSGDGKYSPDELSSVIIFGYLENYAFSRTLSDANGDGYYDG